MGIWKKSAWRAILIHTAKKRREKFPSLQPFEPKGNLFKVNQKEKYEKMLREIKYFSTPKRTSIFISGMQAFPLIRLVFI